MSTSEEVKFKEELVSRFWLPTLNLYVVAGDCNSKEATRKFAITNDRRARVFYTTEKPNADAAVAKGILFAPDGSEETVTMYAVGHGENGTVHFTPTGERHGEGG